MKNVPPSFCPRVDLGAALVLVLCFVVLITGLALAYFSRTLINRQLSNASTSMTQADTVANSAVDMILGDLKQEIVNGSTAPAPGSTPVYLPTKAKYATPQRNTGDTPNASNPSGAMPNLVRCSVQADPMASPGVASRASAANSATNSTNGRSISTTVWNRHGLLPAAGGVTPTASPAVPGTPVSNFKAPDWVFVTAEQGPCILSSPTTAAGGGAVTVTGRYAYAVYDEGGLLDINHTGYPSVSTLPHVGAKPAPSYADLTQLGLTATQVDNLLGWRHYATLQSTGSFPTLQPSTSKADAAYYQLFIANPTSILQVAPTVWSNKTDQTFLSRQRLIDYFNAASIDLKYLQYLGTFSRSLNQPSYAPESNRLQVLPSSAGGNNAGDTASNPSTNITPNFLMARVINTFTRYDGTQAVVGEPLVKKRFPLNRLAWLTYRGPSAYRSTADADMAALLGDGITADFLLQGTNDNIQKYFGLVWQANPLNADGSSPGGSAWTYVHGSSGNSGAILNINNPASTQNIDVVRLQGNAAREPDFFELIKAAINPGSIAKTSLSPSIINPSALSTTHAAQDQYNLDVSLDRAILQIGANIIDQFDTDGFPTRINYNLGGASSGTAVFGDENLPYISRVRAGLLHLVEANPVETDSGVDANNQPKPVLDTGVAALMNYPEIWNLHDWDSSTTATNGSSVTPLQQSVGVVAPTKFKVYAATNTNDGQQQAITVTVWDNPTLHYSCDADPDPAKNPGFASAYHFLFGVPGSKVGGEARYLSESNTRMSFQIDPTTAASETLFREPTLLYTPNIPNGSQLASDTLVASNTGTPNGLGYLALNSKFFPQSGGGLINVASASAPAYNKLPTAEATYIGFYLGAHPLRFWYDSNGATPTDNPPYQTQIGNNDIIYTLACDDGSGNYIPYDSKAVTTNGEPNTTLYQTADFGSGFNGTVDLDYGVRYYQTVDPRSSRFGMLDPWVQRNTNSIPPRKNYSAINLAQGTLKTDREGINAGAALFVNYTNAGSDWFSSIMGWYPGNVMSGSDEFRPGLLSQNNPYAASDGIIATTQLPPDSAGTPSPAFYYADPDGVVRRATGGGVDIGNAPASTTTGLPMAYARGTSATNSSGPPASGDYPAAIRQMDSRPPILNRPFRSVAELGYVYSGTPWKNLDFFLPESGDSAMLDVFCVNDNSDSNALTAGQVNLNTRQVPVLQAILAQASKDEWNDTNSHFSISGNTSSTQAQQLAQLLVNRTAVTPTNGPNSSNGPQPLQNVSDLVGRWISPVSVTTGGIDGKASYDGFATDLATFLDAAATADLPMHNIQRFGESAVRALSNAGQTRVWNLMFDIVAQNGRFTTQAKTLDQFNVEGEQHYWVHVAIDRYTGQVLDKQVEVVTE